MQMKFFTTFANMDSLTQIVLGAACGEIALGKKIGNKALLFGAIGGSIPDLDVFIGNLFYSNAIDAMAFHRGFMHSFVFAFIASYFLGLFIHKLYNTGKRIDTNTTRKEWTLLFFLSILVGICVDDSIYIITQNDKYSGNLHIFPIFVTSTVLAVGFIALAFSNFEWIRPFAWIFLVGIGMAYVMDLFILPLFFNRNANFDERG